MGCELYNPTVQQALPQIEIANKAPLKYLICVNFCEVTMHPIATKHCTKLGRLEAAMPFTTMQWTSTISIPLTVLATEFFTTLALAKI